MSGNGESESESDRFGMETGKTMAKESWINGKYAFLFAKGFFKVAFPFKACYIFIS